MVAPKLRFKEFDSSWNKDLILNVFTNKSKSFKPQGAENLPCIELEHLSKDTGKILGTVNSKEQLSTKNLFESSNVLYGKLRPYLKKFAQPKFQGVCSSEIWVLRGIKISNDYLYQYVQSESFTELTNIQSGSKMPRADWNIISDASIEYPCDKEQTKISLFLSTVDNKIDQMTKEYELLTQYKKGVVQQLFSQKLRFKADDGTDFKNWENRNILDISYVFIGLVTTMTTSYREVGTPLIRNSDIKKNKILKDQLIYLDPKFADIHKNRKLRANDIVTVHTGEVGTSSIISAELEGAIGFATINTRVFNEQINPDYLVCYFNSYKFINWCISVSTGDGRQNLNLKDFNTAIIPTPCLEEQNKIASFLLTIDQKIDNVAAQIDQAKLWKKGLLQQMFV